MTVTTERTRWVPLEYAKPTFGVEVLLLYQYGEEMTPETLKQCYGKRSHQDIDGDHYVDQNENEIKGDIYYWMPKPKNPEELIKYLTKKHDPEDGKRETNSKTTSDNANTETHDSKE